MSDFSVYHRVDDLAALTISRFLMLAVRLGAYGGALKAALTAPRSAEVASAAVTSAAGVPSVGGGDTPPEVIRQMKLAQFAARHQQMSSKPGKPAPPIDPTAIVWDDNAVLSALKPKGG